MILSYHKVMITNLWL